MHKNKALNILLWMLAIGIVGGFGLLAAGLGFGLGIVIEPYILDIWNYIKENYMMLILMTLVLTTIVILLKIYRQKNS